MKKVGTLINANHQLCLAHGIQLAVINVLYRKKDMSHIHIEKASLVDETETDLESEEGISEEDEVGFEVINTTPSSLDVQHEEISPLIAKIRKIVVLFRRSPTKNDNLQKHIKEEFNKELSLIIDSKTRWNSLCAMLERFCEVESAIRKSLIDIKSELSFSENEVVLLKNIIAALQPVKLAVEALCREDVNLYVADITMKFMLDELSAQNTFLSKELKESLIIRIKERRNIYSDILHYLHDPNVINVRIRNDDDDYEIFNKTTKPLITKKIVELIERFALNEESETEISDSEACTSDERATPSTSASASPALTMKEKLQLTIQQKMNKSNLESSAKQSPKGKGLTNVIKREMDFFQEQNIRGKYLDKAFNMLLTVRPTSVESERAFSAAGLICTKLRSSLNDNTLNTMCFLRQHFKQKEELN